MKMKENSKRKHQGQEDTREKELGGEGKDVQTPLIDQSSLHGDLFGTNSFTNTPELGPVDNDLLPHPSFPTPE